VAQVSPNYPLSKDEELKRLKDQANEMHKQIEALESSMNALEKNRNRGFK